MSGSNKVKILMVDDREENLISLAAVLEHPDYDLVPAGSGEEALRRLLQEEFALILLDVQMPGLDGFETAALIKQRERSRHIPIIFITALSKDAPYVYKGYGTGAVDYLTKPFEPEVLRCKVAVFAELHRKSELIKQQAEALRISERMFFERELMRREVEAQRKYLELVDGINHGIVWSADADTLSLGFGSQRIEALLGISVDQWRSEERFLSGRTHPDDLRRVLKALAEARRGGPGAGEIRFEHRIRSADGRWIWFQTVMRVAASALDEARELRGLSIDVSDIKRAEEEARQAVRTRDEFLSIASHELKTPLTTLRLQIQMLQRVAKGGATPAALERLPSAVEVSNRQIERLSKLVDELLDISRINNGRLVLEREPMELSAVLREVCERFGADFHRAGSTLELEAEEGLVGNWDRLRVEQVVTNLVSNAVKYGAGKPIQVTLRAEDGFAVLRVRDQGIGIAPEDQERIFRQYERAVSSTHFGGLGLGLYIVGQILEAHGGAISVASQPGEGAEFRVRLPLQSRPGRTEGRPGLAGEGRPPSVEPRSARAAKPGEVAAL